MYVVSCIIIQKWQIHWLLPYISWWKDYQDNGAFLDEEKEFTDQSDTDCESEPEEDDIIIKDKKRKKNKYLDEEAEDEDEEMQEDDEDSADEGEDEEGDDNDDDVGK